MTLTYEDSNLPRNAVSGLPELSKLDVNLWMKRLRKHNADPLRYYTVGEYGTRTERPHYHSIMFGLDLPTFGALNRLWGKGHVYCGDVTGASIGYVTKYVINKVNGYEGRSLPFANMSKRSGGLGKEYLVSHREWHRADKRFYAMDGGVRHRLPRYYRDRIFTKLELQLHAILAVREGDVAYSREIDRLSRLHPDPTNYFDEAMSEAHELISVRANLNDTF